MKKIDSIKKKIKYRAEYRGIKEMDLLLSGFVKKYIDILDHKELMELYEILEKDDDVIFKWYSSKNDTKEILEWKPKRNVEDWIINEIQK